MATPRAPCPAKPASRRCTVTASGVVSSPQPHARRKSRPACPGTQSGDRMRHGLRQQPGAVVLPLVPVTPITSSWRDGEAKNRSASRLARAARLGTGATMMLEGRLGSRASSGSNRMAAAPRRALRRRNPVHAPAFRDTPKSAARNDLAAIQRDVCQRNIVGDRGDSLQQRSEQYRRARAHVRVHRPPALAHPAGRARAGLGGIGCDTHQAQRPTTTAEKTGAARHRIIETAAGSLITTTAARRGRVAGATPPKIPT